MFDSITEPQEWIDGLIREYAPNSGDIDIAIQNLGLKIKTLSALCTWQPIETAPMDGTRLLLCGGYMSRLGVPSITIGKWAGKRPDCWKDDFGYSFPREPTHWMPLPDHVCQL